MRKRDNGWVIALNHVSQIESNTQAGKAPGN